MAAKNLGFTEMNVKFVRNKVGNPLIVCIVFSVLEYTLRHSCSPKHAMMKDYPTAGWQSFLTQVKDVFIYKGGQAP